ncbi:MAG: DUF1134 domain-containing protein [Sphingomonadales bacterium]|nr:DUF1134 domain-containing protein [Sphingomonadales bacterium]MDE2171635.1 DUF1134 domain-containing protein [Sphingomonadales bacterium]
MWHKAALVSGALALCVAVAGPVGAQTAAQDGQQGIDSDLVKPEQSTSQAPLPPVSSQAPSAGVPTPAQSPYGSGYAPQTAPTTSVPASQTQQPGQWKDGMPPANPDKGGTYHENDLIGAATGVFGTGAKGLAEAIKDILHKQGEPNGYIVGREAGGAFVVGLRYGSGTLYHKIEGERPVYWTGPSIGFDAGANASKTFVLVYNLYNTDDLFHRYAAGEGQAYLVGGFNISYMRRGDVVLIPVRLGVGLRLGINGGYMNFTKKQTWLPF